MLLLFAITLFISSAMLFLVQPMFAKMVLPLLGGTPAVWNTCVVFFQAMLLAGYAYVHLSTSRLRLRSQAVLHLMLLTAPWIVLPIGVARGWMPPVNANPIPWLLGLLLFSVGLPFLAVSTSAPLLQKWFAATGHRHSTDPYFLYAASNLGSLLALLAYPSVLEPWLRLADQSAVWAGGYGLLLTLILTCAVVVGRSRSGHIDLESGAPELTMDDSSQVGISWRRRAWWTALAFVPSSLMLGVTTYLSTDIAAVPLLWIVPLTLYLLTFVIAFASRPLLSVRRAGRLLPILTLPLVILIMRDAAQPFWLVIPFHLVVLFVAATACHGQLAETRPATKHLTEFYLWISAGGMLGGLFNSLIAPLIFTRVIEYPLALVLACLLAPRRAQAQGGPATRWNDLALPAALGLVTVTLARIMPAVDPRAAALNVAVVFGIPAIGCFTFARRPIRFGLGIAVLLLAGAMGPERFGSVLHAERSFYGVHRVTLDSARQQHVLLHGNTIHGRQSLNPSRRREPLTYFHPSGPIGQVFAAGGWSPAREIAVVGLGSGSLAAYAVAGQHWTFYEIDPAVSRIARDPRFFTFLTDSAAEWNIVLGDARLSLASAPPKRYGLLVLDAFSSDAIPVHLITREAMQLYLSKLSDGGILVFHISNNYLRLRPVVAALAADAGLAALAQADFQISDAEARRGKTASEWLVTARNLNTLAALAADRRWIALPRLAERAVWTDDFSNILGVFKWR